MSTFQYSYVERRVQCTLPNQLHHILLIITALISDKHNATEFIYFQRQRNRHLISPVFTTSHQRQHYVESEKDIHDLNN